MFKRLRRTLTFHKAPAYRVRVAPQYGVLHKVLRQNNSLVYAYATPGRRTNRSWGGGGVRRYGDTCEGVKGEKLDMPITSIQTDRPNSHDVYVRPAPR